MEMNKDIIDIENAFIPFNDVTRFELVHKFLVDLILENYGKIRQYYKDA